MIVRIIELFIFFIVTLIEKLFYLSENLAIENYGLTFKFPKYEIYALADQIRRALVSVTSNIREGHSRKLERDKLRFYRIAHGSLAEVKFQMKLAYKQGYIIEEKYQSFFKLSEELSKLLTSMIQAIDR